MKIVRQTTTITCEMVGLQCDRCGLEVRGYQNFEHQMEQQEFLSLTFTAGFGGKAFRDGHRYEIHLCQYCVAATLGPWLRLCESPIRISPTFQL